MQRRERERGRDDGSRVQVPHLRGVRTPACEQRRAGRRAHSLLHIILLQQEALASQRVCVWSDHPFAAAALDERAAWTLHARALGAELVAKVIDGEKLTEERSVRQVSQTARRCRVRATETEFDPSRQSRRHCAQQCVATVRRDSARDGGSPRRSAVSRRSPRVPAG